MKQENVFSRKEAKTMLENDKWHVYKKVNEK